MYVYTHTRTQTGLSADRGSHAYIMCVCVYVYIYIYMLYVKHIYIYIYIYIYIHTHKTGLSAGHRYDRGSHVQAPSMRSSSVRRDAALAALDELNSVFDKRDEAKKKLEVMLWFKANSMKSRNEALRAAGMYVYVCVIFVYTCVFKSCYGSRQIT